MASPIWPKPPRPRPAPPVPPPTVQEKMDILSNSVREMNASFQAAIAQLGLIAAEMEKGASAGKLGDQAMSDLAKTVLATTQEALGAVENNTRAMKEMLSIVRDTWDRIEIEVTGRDGKGNIKVLELRKVS